MGEKPGRQALYRRYRSQTLDEVVGQEHITNALKTAIAGSKLSHAYLFTGPHGVGKTSVARILAHQVNNLQYDGVNNHIDIIEIDAASNRGIDEVRELREKALIAPSQARYKIYIIDEVHMLTTHAFNALLKLLEEPPAHVIFILATTEAHKIPNTIRSRSQWYGFRQIDSKRVLNHLKTIAKAEKITIDDEALQLVAEFGRGSLRDSIGLLDQLASAHDSIGEADVRALVGLASTELIDNIMQAVDTGDYNQLRQILDNAKRNAVGGKLLARQLIDHIQTMPINRQNLNRVNRLMEVFSTPEADLKLELELLDMTLANQPQPAVQVKYPAKTESMATPSEDAWSLILADIKKQHNSLYAMLRMASPELEPGHIRLVFAFPFHKQKMEEDANKQIIRQIAKKHLKEDVRISTAVESKSPLTTSPKQEEPDIAAVIKVMGGGEPSTMEDNL